MITIKIRRLDQVSLVRRYPSIKAWEEFCQTLGVAKDSAANSDLQKFKNEYATTFAKSYLGKQWGTGVSFDFFSVQKKPAIAINVTPFKLSEDDWADFLALLTMMFPFGPKQVWKEFKLSRLEVAVDVKLPFSELICLAPRLTIINQNYQKKGTLYLGHEFGRRSYCIYDKRKQLAETKGVHLEHDLTRIEVTLRQTGKTLGQLDEFTSPFGNLLVLRKSSLDALQKKDALPVEVGEFISSVLSGCPAQQVYLGFDSPSRKRLMKHLRPLALGMNPRPPEWIEWIAKQRLALEQRFLGAG